MKKRIYSVISLVGIGGIFGITPLMAQSPSNLPPPQWRIGVGLAGEYLNTEANISLVPLTIKLGNIETRQSQFAKKLQLAPCIELGTTVANNYYLGLLLSWRYSGAQDKSRSPIRGNYYFLHTMRTNHYTDFLVKAGYACSSNTMLYGLIGPSLANWTHTTDQIIGDQTLIDKFKTKKTSLGLGIGVGFEYRFKKNHAISVDYTNHFHRATSHSKQISYQEMDALGNLTIRTGVMVKRIKPSYSTIAIRFTTYFQL